MVFHIPFTLGNLKFIVCTTPVEGHCSIMRVQARCTMGGKGAWFAACGCQGFVLSIYMRERIYLGVLTSSPLPRSASSQTLIDSDSWLVRAVGWLVTGVAVSQLAADIEIMSHRIRLRKPMRQPRDGPPGSAGKLAAWLAQFYSEGSDRVGKGSFLDW